MHTEDLRDAIMQPGHIAVERCEAADVHAGEIGGGRSVDDPLGQCPPRPARRGDADRVEPGSDEEVGALRRLAEDELVVRREALRAVVELLETGALQGWDP